MTLDIEGDTVPNWCYNNLQVEGSREDIKRFLDAVANEEGQYDLTLPYPCPEELQISATFILGDAEEDDEERAALRKQYAENVEKYGAPHWYDWQVKNWGTKWPPTIDEFFLDDKRVQFRFDSAWSPPSGLIQKLSAEFQTLTFVLWYDESGMCFAGAESFQAGDMVYNGYFEYDSVPEWSELSDADFDDEESWEKMNEIIRDALDQRIDEAECALSVLEGK